MARPAHQAVRHRRPRKKARVESKLEKLSVGDTIRAVKFAEVVILMIDAVQGIDRQDLVIADRALYEGGR